MMLRPGAAAMVGALVAAAALAHGDPAAAAYPGGNGEIAFTANAANGTRHIYLKAATGVIDLTGPGSTAIETQPRFSPDGREIAFTRFFAGNGQIDVMTAHGAHRTELTDTPTGNTDPTWSPDGTRLAFVSSRDGGVPNIFTMRTDGTQLRQITHDAATESELAWSPTGDRIAFVGEPAGGGGARDIFSMRADGGDRRDLTSDPTTPDLEPSWSPDGSRIVYSGAIHPGGGSVGGDLWIMNADGGADHALIHQPSYSDGSYPAWSPDGTTIAFAANNGTGYLHVWSVPASGGRNAELVANSIPDGNPVDEDVAWQPLAHGGARPMTRIVQARINRRRHHASFRFRATGPAIGYRCSLRLGRHRARWRRCGARQAYAHLRPGRYVLKVLAQAPGEPYRHPARRRFTIPSRGGRTRG